MSQMQWTYVDDYLRRYHVGLYHGPSSGHLMIHCNGKVIVIDFNVRETKKYTFYINDELFDCHVERSNGHFAYGLEIDEKTATPRNLIRKRRNRADLIKTLVGTTTFLLFIASMLYFLS